MADIPTAIERRSSKPKLNVHAPPFIPSSPPLIGSFSSLTIRSRSPENEPATVMSYSAALRNVKPKPKPFVPAPSVAPIAETVSTDQKDGEPSPSQRQQPAARKKKPTKEIPFADFLLKLDQEKVASKVNQGPNKASPRNGDNFLKPRISHKDGHKGEKQTTAVGTVPRGNILDSTVPVLHKGKQRENPKKKYTRMKKAILSERKQRQESQPGQEDSPAEDESKEQREDGNGSATVEIAVSGNSEDEPTVAKSESRPRQQGRRSLTTFRDNVLSDELNARVIDVISKLGRFQDRLYAEDPEKARKKKRLVYGLREVHKFLTVEKIKCVILAPNIESASGAGGLDEMLSAMLKMCREQNVPYFFALTKMKLGYISHKHAPVSCAGILNYQGADEQYKAMLECAGQAKAAFSAAASESPAHQPENQS